VPQQALFLMNSPFIRSQSEKVTAQIPVEGSAVDSQTIKALYQRVLARDPKPDEVELAQRFVNDANALQSSKKPAKKTQPQQSPLSQLTQVLLMSNEFQFVD
jgi:hypothetical protein